MRAFLRHTLGSMAVILLSSPFLSGQEISFGLQAHGASPLSDLKTDTDSKLGLGGGAFMLIDLYDGHAFKPWLDFSTFRNSDFHKDTLGAGHDLKVGFYSIGVDYNYYFGEKSGEGWYVLVGGGFCGARTTWEGPADQLKDTRYGGKASAGVGIVAAPHIGFEARINTGKYSTYDQKGLLSEGNGNQVTLGVYFLF